MSEPIRLLFTSDLHLNAKGCITEEMVGAFSKVIFPLLEETDIFFINGDFFDDLMNFDGPSFDPIYTLVHNLFACCERNHVTLRLLQGTWSHDRNQCKRLETFYKNKHASFDFRFFETTDLEEITIRDRSLRIVYVPDDLPYKNSGDIVDVIKSKMVERGWDKVDYACMHGFFDVTYPKNISHGTSIVFNEDQFPFVTKMIDCGHVHQYRAVGKFVSNGSFDRCGFGDEDPKGCIRVLDYLDRYRATFIENPYSAVYDTLEFFAGEDTLTIKDRVQKHLDGLKTDRRISLRLTVASSDQYEALKSWLKETRPDVRCMRHKRSDKDSGGMILPPSNLIDEDEETVLIPTRQNLSSFIRTYIPDTYVLSQDRIDTFLEMVA